MSGGSAVNGGGRVRGFVPEQDLVMQEDHQGSVVRRTFYVDTRIDVPHTPEGDAFWADLREVLKDPTQAGLDKAYKLLFAFASQELLTPGGRGHAMLQAAFGQITVDKSKVPAVKTATATRLNTRTGQARA